MLWHRSIGTIIYDPPRPGMKQRTNWWCVVNVDREITRYYRWWLSYEKHIHTLPPSWDAHISVIRGERPKDGFLEKWKQHHGRKVEFLYRHGDIRVDVSQRTDDRAHLATKGLYYFTDVQCPELDEIRTELGLITGFKYHLTLGRTYDYVPAKRGR